ncbi:GvpL/GvpF family gas vesicle protein [Streptomyces dysideae]|uniref:Gas vesicle protein n=1 Tax=Streptomyces dysideae TaxID=909626 RepID=A0A124IFC3_9ACTN|nr:GvpL/GvpF family gas vesicle protein [Streptomyces dysideae]KUO21006.1 gas vesicle protein [Streptomyces dysideae]
MNGQVSYAYAVVRSSPSLERTALPGVRGVADSAVTLVHSGALAAAVSAVPREEFSEAALKVRLEDLGWLETTARAHHFVIETLAAHTTVLPLRLATVYLDEDRVGEMLSEREQDFTAMLDRLADHVEWGVKVYAEAPTTSAAPSAAALSAGEGGPADEEKPGRAYLRRRRYQRQAREDAWRLAEEAVRRTEAQARGLAVERARHRPQQGDLAGQASGENVANDAYLVPRRLAEKFRSRMLHAADGLQGVRVDVTGPWAPYSFALPPAPDAQEGTRYR